MIAYCEKKKIFVLYGSKVVIIKIKKDYEKVMKILNCNSSMHDFYIEYAENYPDRELETVHTMDYIKSYKEVLQELKAIA